MSSAPDEGPALVVQGPGAERVTPGARGVMRLSSPVKVDSGDVAGGLAEDFQHYFAFVPASAVRIDLAYQRNINMKHAKGIADHFRPYYLTALLVSDRGDGDYVLIAGHHRWYAVTQLLGMHDYPLPCIVYEGLTEQQEADIFATVDKNRKNQRPDQLLRADIVAGNPQALDIVEIVKQVGLKARMGESAETLSGRINAVSALRRIYEFAGPDHLRRVLQTIYDAYGEDHRAYQAYVLHGIDQFLRRYGYKVDDDRLHMVLRANDIETLLNEARDWARLKGGIHSLARGFGLALQEHYNKAFRGSKNKLPEWGSIFLGRRVVVKEDREGLQMERALPSPDETEGEEETATETNETAESETETEPE